MPKLTFAVDYTTRGGASYKAGSTHEVADRREAANLVVRGLARPADAPAPADAQPAPAGTTEKKK